MTLTSSSLGRIFSRYHGDVLLDCISNTPSERTQARDGSNNEIDSGWKRMIRKPTHKVRLEHSKCVNSKRARIGREDRNVASMELYSPILNTGNHIDRGLKANTEALWEHDEDAGGQKEEESGLN
ncbi:hypothetical protein Trydic_g20182 [Trypoxylus dichotomus]